MKQVMGEKEVDECLGRVTERILTDNPDLKNLVLLGIITRGFDLAKRIAERIVEDCGIEVQVGSLDTRPYRDDAKDTPIAEGSNIPFSIADRDIILVDDVMSTGRTIRAAMDAVMAHGRPKSIKTAVLIDRGLRELPISADYVGANIPTSVSEQIRVRLREVDGQKDGAYIVSQ